MMELISKAAAIEAMRRSAYWQDAERKIEEMPTVDSVPIRPLARWLAGFCMPPKSYYSGIRTDAQERAEAWTLWLRELMESGVLDDG